MGHTGTGPFGSSNGGWRYDEFMANRNLRARCDMVTIAKRMVDQWDNHDRFPVIGEELPFGQEPNDVKVARAFLEICDAVRETVLENLHLADGERDGDEWQSISEADRQRREGHTRRIRAANLGE